MTIRNRCCCFIGFPCNNRYAYVYNNRIVFESVPDVTMQNLVRLLTALFNLGVALALYALGYRPYYYLVYYKLERDKAAFLGLKVVSYFLSLFAIGVNILLRLDLWRRRRNSLPTPAAANAGLQLEEGQHHQQQQHQHQQEARKINRALAVLILIPLVMISLALIRFAVADDVTRLHLVQISVMFLIGNVAPFFAIIASPAKRKFAQALLLEKTGNQFGKIIDFFTAATTNSVSGAAIA